MYHSSALDLCAKGTQLCKFLMEEKNENLVSEKLFCSICEMSKYAYAMDNPSLSKADIAAFRKSISIEYYNVMFYLETIYNLGYISVAQKDSMIKTIDSLKKQINF